MNRTSNDPDPRTYPQRRNPRLPPSVYATHRTVHVTWTTHRRQRLLASPPLAALTLGVVAARPETLAACIMPDHVHWLLETNRLTDSVNRVKSVTTALFWRQGRDGKIWQRSFYDRVLRSGDDRRRVAEYVVANPVRAGLVSEVDAYPWTVVWWSRFGD